MKCELCPRKCGIDRTISSGFCGAKTLKVALVMLHQWEEPIISAGKGSGAIFFSHCSLKCVYCQNSEISHEGKGEEISVERLAEIFKELEEQGVVNINLVSPTHYTNEIEEAINIYKPNIPIVWNTNGYEEVETIKRVSKFVDVFLTDLKYVDSNLSKEYSNAENYFEKTSKAILEMKKQKPNDIIENGIMQSGVIVRHLVLPGCAKDSIAVLDWINKALGAKTYISLMSQYLPCYIANKFSQLNRKIKPLEYKSVLSHAIKLGFENGFFQEFDSASKCFIPKF